MTVEEDKTLALDMKSYKPKRRQDVEHCPLGSNGKAPVFKVPFDKLESYDTPAEVREIALSVFN